MPVVGRRRAGAGRWSATGRVVVGVCWPVDGIEAARGRGVTVRVGLTPCRGSRGVSRFGCVADACRPCVSHVTGAGVVFLTWGGHGVCLLW